MKAKEKFFGLDIPFIDLLRAKAEHWEKGRAVASIEMRPELQNSWQYAHGGVVMTLLDVTMGSAARSQVPHAAGVVTVDMSVSFLSVGQGRLMKISEICIRRPVFATVLSLTVILIGIVSYSRLPVREYPKIDEPVVTVDTNGNGISARLCVGKCDAVSG